jgi:hypothetical protein
VFLSKPCNSGSTKLVSHTGSVGPVSIAFVGLTHGQKLTEHVRLPDAVGHLSCPWRIVRVTHSLATRRRVDDWPRHYELQSVIYANFGEDA